MNAAKLWKPIAPIVGAGLVAGAAAYAIQRSNSSTFAAAQECESPDKPAPKTFTSGIFFQDLKLRSSEAINHNTKRLRFDLPSPDATSGLQPISALLTKAHINGSWLPTIRPYTPISDPNERGHIDLLVKRYENGPMSNHLHSLHPGQTHSFKTGPLETYAWTPNKHAHIALIAGGAGITPLYQLTKTILSNPADTTKITLLFGVNTDADLLFQPEFTSLEKIHGAERFRCVYTVSHPDPASKDSPYVKGYITKALLEETIPPASSPGLKILFCGPPGMEKAIVGGRGWVPGSQGAVGGVLGGMGYSAGQVVKL